MKYVFIDTYEDGTYQVGYERDLIELFQNYCTGGTYHTIIYRLFGLLPQDFYHYLAQEYHAIFQRSPYLKSYIRVKFSKQTDAIRFAQEIETRLKYFIDRGDFK